MYNSGTIQLYLNLYFPLPAWNCTFVSMPCTLGNVISGILISLDLCWMDSKARLDAKDSIRDGHCFERFVKKQTDTIIVSVSHDTLLLSESSHNLYGPLNYEITPRTASTR